MLDALEPGEFDEWLAFEEIEPEPLGRIIKILRTGLPALCNCWGAKLSPEDFDVAMAQENQPTDASGAPGVPEVSPDQGAAMVRSVLGAN